MEAHIYDKTEISYKKLTNIFSLFMFSDIQDWLKYYVTPYGQRIVSDRVHHCDKCFRSYKYRTHLLRHQRFECGKERQFGCRYCTYRCHQKDNMTAHIKRKHSNKDNGNSI